MLTACSSEQKPAASEAKKCVYGYDAISTELKWTAYKFTAKTGVSGTFDSMEILGTQEADSPEGVFANAQFNIDVTSLNSNAADRDAKILEHFFGNLADTSLLTGKVLALNGDRATVELTMNKLTRSIIMDLQVTGTSVMLSGDMQLGDWDAVAAADALNKVCYDLHKGTDGVSKLWPEVRIEIGTTVSELCE
jgi:polyisoprenoid-binding protein YceI